jgi:signal transduction histidine kinase/ligand-binding sensor domain-containing protein/ActR/RegA family two-component response regulator
MRFPSTICRMTVRGVAFSRRLAVCLALSAIASGDASAQRLQFRQLTPDHGLSSSLVESIIQDSRGFVWLGTKKGIDRYDGHSFTTYRHRTDDSTSVIDNEATTLYEDSEKSIWVGTPIGLSRYVRDRDDFRSYRIVPGDTVAVSAIVEAEGTLWLGTTRGLYRFDRKTDRATPYSTALARLDVRGLLADRRHHLWLGTKNGGAIELDPRTGRTREWVKDRDVRQFAEDAQGVVYAAMMDGGLAKIDRRSDAVTQYRHDPRDSSSIAIDAVHALLLDGTRGLWVGTENGGLDYLDFATQRFRHNRFDPTEPSGLNSNSIWALFEDPSGTLWVGTFAGGVNISLQNGNAIQRYRFVAGDPTSLSYNSVMGFLEDSRGGTWVATDGGGLNRFDRATGRFRRYTTQTSNLNSDAVLSLTEDRLGNIWIATWGGSVSRFDPRSERFTAFTPRNSGMADEHTFAVHADRSGNVWVGTFQHGLQRVDPATGVFSEPILLGRGNESQIRVITELSDGNLLIGTTASMTSIGGGMIEYDPRTGRKRWYAVGKGGISGIVVNAIVEAEPGIVWIGTSNGLDRLDRRRDTIDHFTQADGLPGAAVNGIVIDPSGRIWVSGDRGITRFDPATRRGKLYTVADGLQGSEFNFTASYRLRDGSMLFGGSQGFNLIEPAKIAENTHVPPIVFTGFQLANRPVPIGVPGSPLTSSVTETKRIVLRHDQGVFTIDFAALDFVAPEKNRYAYKLEGRDGSWNEIGTSHSASYTNLTPGRYTFRVRGTNNDGVWNERGAAIEIVVTPPFWATWWFRTLLTMIVAGIVAAIVRSAQARHRTLQALHEHDRESQQYLERNVLDILGAMQRFSGGDYSVALAVSSEDAIGKLRSGFNSVVADRKRAEEELRQSQKMEAVGRLAGGVAHDFNNLLTVIKGNAELALSDLESMDAVREEVEEIERAAERASSLTRQLLAFSRKQILKPQQLSLNEMVVEVGRMLRRTVGEDIELEISLDPSLGLVRADPGQIEQVLLNLVVNARDAMPRGGKLVVTTKNVSAGDVRDLPDAEDVPYVAITVADNGTGMEPEVRDRVFEPFFTTKEQGKGTGLGLSTVYGSVKQSGGFVVVDSTLGVGSTFGVYLPRVNDTEELRLTGEFECGPSGSATVLLVEDEDAVRRLASRVLERAGYVVLTAASADAAMEVASSFDGRIDLLLTDVVMPGRSGRELAEQLMPMHAGMRLLYASGYTEDAIIRHGVSSQQTAFLEKPFTPNALLRKVRQVLDAPVPEHAMQLAG